MSTVEEEATPPVECSSRASPSPAGGAASNSGHAGDRNRTGDSVAASFIRDRMTGQQGESKLSEGPDSTFGKPPGVDFINTLRTNFLSYK